MLLYPARLAPTALATRACRQSPYLRPSYFHDDVILIMTSFATEAGPWALATPSVTDVRTPFTAFKYITFLANSGDKGLGSTESVLRPSGSKIERKHGT